MSGDRLRLRVRGAATLLAAVAAVVVVVLLGTEPHLDRVAVLALLGLLVAVLVWELVPDHTSPWRRAVVAPHLAPGQDRATATWVRVLEDHHESAARLNAAQYGISSNWEGSQKMGTFLVKVYYF